MHFCNFLPRALLTNVMWHDDRPFQSSALFIRRKSNKTAKTIQNLLDPLGIYAVIFRVRKGCREICAYFFCPYSFNFWVSTLSIHQWIDESEKREDPTQNGEEKESSSSSSFMNSYFLGLFSTSSLFTPTTISIPPATTSRPSIHPTVTNGDLRRVRPLGGAAGLRTTQTRRLEGERNATSYILWKRAEVLNFFCIYMLLFSFFPLAEGEREQAGPFFRDHALLLGYLTWFLECTCMHRDPV